MAIVRFAAYRIYEDVRTEMNNAIMALAAGAQLAAHLLKLNEGSSLLLPDVFPRVEHIGRFSLTSQAARDILEEADRHLGAMAVPYVLAVHEDYMKTCLGMLERAGKVPSGTAADTRSVGQHSAMAAASAAGGFSADAAAQLHTLRKMRNCVIHSGGRASRSLVNDVTQWQQSAASGWVNLARDLRGMSEGDQVTFEHGEVLLALAVTKTLAREANEILQRTLDRSTWAVMVLDELLQHDQHALKGQMWLRKATGHARFHFRVLNLTTNELQAAHSRR